MYFNDYSKCPCAYITSSSDVAGTVFLLNNHKLLGCTYSFSVYSREYLLLHKNVQYLLQVKSCYMLLAISHSFFFVSGSFLVSFFLAAQMLIMISLVLTHCFCIWMQNTWNNWGVWKDRLQFLNTFTYTLL